MIVVEPDRLGGEGIEMRRFQDGVSVAGNVSIPLVVGDDQDHVGLVRGDGGEPGQGDHEDGEKGEQCR